MAVKECAAPIPCTSANSALRDFFQPLGVIRAAGCARHADGCDLSTSTDAAPVPFACQNFVFNTCDAIALRHVVGIVAVETHVVIPDVVPFAIALAVTKGSNEAVDGPAMLEPLRLALSIGEVAMAGAEPYDRVFRRGMPVPHAAARLCIEQPTSAIAGLGPTNLQSIGFTRRAICL